MSTKGEVTFEPRPRATGGRRQSARVQPARRRRQEGVAGRLQGAPCRRVLLPGGLDPGMHQTGLRFPRQPARPQRRRPRCRSASPPTSRRSWPSSATPRGLTFPLLSDPDRKVLTGLGRLRREQMYGKTVPGRDPLHLRRGRKGQNRCRTVQRQGCTYDNIHQRFWARQHDFRISRRTRRLKRLPESSPSTRAAIEANGPVKTALQFETRARCSCANTQHREHTTQSHAHLALCPSPAPRASVPRTSRTARARC